MDYYIITPLLFILRIIEIFSEFSLTLEIANNKVSIKRLFSASFLLTILYEVSKICTPQYLSSLISAILAISVIMLIFKVSIKKSMLSFLVTITTVAIIDCIVSVIILKVCNFPTFYELSQSEFAMTVGRIIIAASVFLIAYCIKLIKLRKGNSQVEGAKKSLNLITIIVTFFTLFPNIVMIVYYHDKKTLPFSFILINIFAINAMFFISLYNTRRVIKFAQAEEELITEKTYNKTLEDLVDGLRTFKHDYNNTLQTMYGYILTDNMIELKFFFNQILNESREITALDKLKPELFKNPSLFGLVTAKFEYARKSEVTMNLEIYGELDNLDIKTYDFTRMFGIFLDNAIEAAAGSEKKVVNLYVAERNDRVTIEISNSFSDTGLTVEEMSKKGVSSKGDNRGLGLYKVKEILKKYPRIKHDTNSSNDMFLQRLIIDKVKEVSLK